MRGGQGSSIKSGTPKNITKKNADAGTWGNMHGWDAYMYRYACNTAQAFSLVLVLQNIGGYEGAREAAQKTDYPKTRLT